LGENTGCKYFLAAGFLGGTSRQVRPVGEGENPQHDDVSERNEPEQYPPPAISRFLDDFDHWHDKGRQHQDHNQKMKDA
jgi:hypothetical protein